MTEQTLIIGITGAFGSGKSTAASFLEEKGFQKISLVWPLEEEVKRRGVRKITRKVLQDIGNQWRKKYGSSILAKKASALLQERKARKTVVEGIRNVGEIDELKKHGKLFVLVAIVSDRQVRFERLKKLKRRESLTWELFTKLDWRDLGLGQKSTGLQVAQCIAMADIFIDNNGLMEEFKTKLERLLQNLA